MTISRKEASQMTIFDCIRLAEQSAPAPAGCMDFIKEFKTAMAEDLRHALDEQGRELSRYEVAARMSGFTAGEVTKSALDNWTAMSHQHIIPAVWIPAFVLATGGRRAFEVLSRRSGLFALPGPEALRAEIQRLDEEIKNKRAEKHKRELFLKEIERK